MRLSNKGTLMNTSEIFLIAMTTIFTVSYLIWRAGKMEYYAPLVVVQIITGILLAPGILGAAFPDYYSFVFNAPVIQALNGIAWWAVIMFVWIVGIGMSCAVTALPILILLMEKLDVLHQPIGQRILRYANLDDIAIWGVLTIILMDWHRAGKQLALIMIIFVNILLDKQIITSETFTALLLMAVASTMLTIPVVSPKLQQMKEIIFRSK